MSRRHRILLIGFGLALLLAGGVGAALVWPEPPQEPPSDAERAAELLHEGMSQRDVARVLSEAGGFYPYSLGGPVKRDDEELDEKFWQFEDDSMLIITTRPAVGSGWSLVSFRTTPPAPVPPMTRLRRTLGIQPFLGE